MIDRKTLRERIFGPGAIYEGGGNVPVSVLLATWLAFRLEKGAHHLRMWGHRAGERDYNKRGNRRG